MPLAPCVLLAALVHLWLALMLGNAPAGTAMPGQGVWGAINVTLRGTVDGRELRSPLPPLTPVLPQGPVGAAADPRWGGAVRRAPPQPEAAPGGATLGRWAESPVAPPKLDVPAAAIEAPPDRPPAPQSPPGRVVQERLPPESTLLPAPAAPEAVAPAPAVRQLAPAPEPAAATLAPALTRTGPLPVAPLPALAAALPTLAAPIVEPPPPVVTDTPAAPVLRQLGRDVPAVAARQAPLPRVEALPSLAVPGDLPAALTAGPSPRAPDAGPQIGHDVATLPAQPASAPRLNLELPRVRGGELSRYSTTGLLPVLPRPPEQPDKLGQEIEKAAKPDCRNAYGGLGVLAVVPLAVDAVRSGGCKW